jgi:hypothetical protein
MTIPNTSHPSREELQEQTLHQCALEVEADEALNEEIKDWEITQGDGIDIHQDMSLEPLIPNTETIEAMQEARRGGLVSFDSAEALMTDLNADA